MKFCSMMLCLALCAACSSDNDEVEGPQPSKQSYPLTIEVTENPLVPDGDAVRSATKAVITTTSTLSQFSMNYVYGNNSTGSETATKNGEGKWKSEGSWPNDAADNGADRQQCGQHCIFGTGYGVFYGEIRFWQRWTGYCGHDGAGTDIR